MERFDESLGEYDIAETPIYISDDYTLIIAGTNSDISRHFKVIKGTKDCNVWNTLLEDERIKMCRLSMDNPKNYINGIGSNWIMTNEEFDEVMSILEYPSKRMPNLTNKEYLMKEWKRNYIMDINARRKNKMRLSKYKTLLFNAIICLFDQSCYDYIDDPMWIDYVCTNIGITRKEYNKIMQTEE